MFIQLEGMIIILAAIGVSLRATGQNRTILSIDQAYVSARILCARRGTEVLFNLCLWIPI